MVFDAYVYDLQGTLSTHPATTTPVETPIPSQVPAILIPEQGKQVMLPLHILARLGQPGEQITADLVWQDGTKLSHPFTLLKGEDGRGLLVANLDWVNMLQPPEPKTQPATLYLRDAAGKVLAEQTLVVVGPTDANTQQIKLYWTISGTDTTVQPQTRQVLKAANTRDLAATALNELLWGPPEISQVGFTTAIPTAEKVLAYPGRTADWGPRITLLNLTIENGVATADFSKELNAYGGGSLRVKLISDQIRQTLEQFPGISEVRIAIEGRTGDVLQP
jgi:hypothetical protein